MACDGGRRYWLVIIDNRGDVGSLYNYVDMFFVVKFNNGSGLFRYQKETELYNTNSTIPFSKRNYVCCWAFNVIFD